MDPISFGIVKGEVQRLPLKDDKVKAIAYAQGHFYAEQVGELLREFSFDDGRLKGLQACVGKMLPATCVGIFPILRAFSFDNNKVQALELVALQLTDPLNFQVFNEVISVLKDRERVRIIMQRRATMGPPQMPAPMNPTLAGNPYPYGRPQASMDPNDPLITYRAVDNALGSAVNGACSAVNSACDALFGRPSRPGAVIVQRPVAYKTTTTAYVVPPGSGMQVLNVPPGATVQTISSSTSPGTTYLVGQAPPPYQPYPTKQ